MDKIWYIYIKDHAEGPFSFTDLHRDPRITPDTFVWKQGFKAWKRVGQIPELKKLFDDNIKPSVKDYEQTADPMLGANDELVADFGVEPPNFFWILIALIVMLYVVINLLF